ncbi:FxsA family protein [Aquicoccus porphyridii]|uniref:FxsA family protein n=1 Tax=Aquicoccus porphyridii TaxID=1852029 RepID=A0A5A9Z7V3_9RHOB|nr:FxsA family protein [Aquicoccus porphyridii]KAA0913241.1 FxsA family protein [Aquicoccus porphyridii]RAI52258.1 FxsA family protein [Rhodobacteraceae bacterium AsT-22]
MWLLLAFIAVPLIEIALFIEIGGAIGLVYTLVIVVLTAILGTWLVRTQGRMALGQLEQAFSERRDPTEPLAHGAMILFSGALLLTPGFFTDALGFALLIPGFRRAAFRWLRSRVRVTHFSSSVPPQEPNPHRQDESVIDADYVDLDPPRKPTHDSSGWTKH